MERYLRPFFKVVRAKLIWVSKKLERALIFSGYQLAFLFARVWWSTLRRKTPTIVKRPNSCRFAYSSNSCRIFFWFNRDIDLLERSSRAFFALSVLTYDTQRVATKSCFAPMAEPKDPNSDGLLYPVSFRFGPIRTHTKCRNISTHGHCGGHHGT